ncbi:MULTISPECIES: hypothetical protein [Sinobaca]|uniref:Uncharacterized protein n=1 Tax=Sinobaca qinghaiensis TaxID=342944 RepID=A0A419V909_9BACL|nr:MULTISPECIES: hypothetical protein [Sinobaca]RKD76453.1 hypothetical protein ATL39_0670 [Sinobaca qinghaiensis]
MLNQQSLYEELLRSSENPTRSYIELSNAILDQSHIDSEQRLVIIKRILAAYEALQPDNSVFPELKSS